MALPPILSTGISVHSKHAYLGVRARFIEKSVWYWSSIGIALQEVRIDIVSGNEENTEMLMEFYC